MRQGGGTPVLYKPAFRFSHFYLSKAVFMYIVRSLPFIPSPSFILSPCFIPSPQSVVRNPCFILTGFIGSQRRKTTLEASEKYHLIVASF